MELRVEAGVGGLDLEEVPVGPRQLPRLVFLAAPLSNRQRDRRVEGSPDRRDDLRQPISVEIILFAALEHNGFYAGLANILNGGQNLVLGEPVPRQAGVPPVQAAVPARVAADIGELDDPAQQDAVADRLPPDGVGETEQQVQVRRVCHAQNGTQIREVGHFGRVNPFQDRHDATAGHDFSFSACLR